MNHSIRFLILLTLLSNCAIRKHASIPYESERLKIEKIGKNTFVHVSYLQTNDFGNVACNGMVCFNQAEALVFDTPTNDEASSELINWIEHAQHKKIKAVVVTHFHEDCLGGIKTFHRRGIPSISNNKTIEILTSKHADQVPETGFDTETQLKIGGENVSLAFFGEGHTADNIVGYIPSEHALFGGCLVKCMDAGKGYLGDANTAEWSPTVKKIKARFPDVKIVVPGHGRSGGIELLDYTIQLFKE